MVFNRDLVAFLLDGLDLQGTFGHAVVQSSRAGAHRVLHLDQQKSLRASLVIAADGKNSQLRRDEDIQRHERDFRQTALTGRIEHSQPHHGRGLSAIFTRPAPLAFLPLAGAEQASSFIWG